jgi:hypothetical protein
MAKRDLQATIKNVTVNDLYDITIYQMQELKARAKDKPFDALEDAFKYGYVMGSRAAKAEARQRAAAAHTEQ